ncbi:hypothetical protein Q5Y75_05750 [Ruegeria sp. 2205SS24-7]|uniref:hypothetical protein n=1 Tax=Ruegeria discodermiae TaxID=3064389 RepID=UPI002742390B|nr:hypothetical protein [Ruegeria sp. 2205SS24-7]MDP5216715.1 hypothetical protein [Ruegeria sp. 2205SS24-7]
MTKPQIIKTITSLEELAAYEAEAKKRGITGEELVAIHERRKALTPKQRKRR